MLLTKLKHASFYLIVSKFFFFIGDSLWMYLIWVTPEDHSFKWWLYFYPVMFNLLFSVSQICPKFSSLKGCIIFTLFAFSFILKLYWNYSSWQFESFCWNLRWRVCNYFALVFSNQFPRLCYIYHKTLLVFLDSFSRVSYLVTFLHRYWIQPTLEKGQAYSA